MSTPEIEAKLVTEVATLATESSPSELIPAPPLFADKSFLGMAVTQFLGAFNDNLYKQLVLLLSIAAGGAAAAEATDEQWLPMLIFAAPFLAFTGYAGYLSDKFSKRKIIILCKFAEIIIMALGGIGFYIYWTR